MVHVIGGKQVFGLSRVGLKGKIIIPKEALEEYKMKPNSAVILMSGTRLSGGFELTSPEIIDKSPPLKKIFKDNPKLSRLDTREGRTIEYEGKLYCWVKVDSDKSITVPVTTLLKFGVQPGELLPSVGGNYLKLGFPTKGPTVRRARQSSELGIYEDRAEQARIDAAKKQSDERKHRKAAAMKMKQKNALRARKIKENEPKEKEVRFGLMSVKLRKKDR